jgi:nucleoside-diphosphate-sugar epimerase
MVNWLIKVLQYSNNKCPIFNVGSDKVIELRALANKVSKITNKKVDSKKQNSKRFDYYVPSINKAKKTLNLKISIGLNEALNSTIKHLNDSN